jgi:hypothetical protein
MQLSPLPNAKQPRLAASADRLGKYITCAESAYLLSSSWGDFIQRQRGDPEIPSNVQALPHPAAPLLSRIAKHGVPVLLQSSPWSDEQKHTAILRGSHQSAKLETNFLRDEMADMVAQHFWTVLPYQHVQHLPTLRLSPMGVVPQRDRRSRPIVDYSFSQVNAIWATLVQNPPCKPRLWSCLSY